MNVARRKLRVLYIVYWGALEPLGRSLVVPSILRLARLGPEFTLLTFEKSADLEKADDVEQLKRAFNAAGVRWRPLRYHKSPKWPATVFDAGVAIVTAVGLRLRGRFDVVHARTFVAGPMGYAIARLIGAHFVYHNEGFYPDEQVDGGVWKEGSSVHRFALWIEGFLYDHARGIVSLSERARTALMWRSRVAAAGTPIIVVPSAVDLDAFQPAPEAARAPGLSLVYLGSVGLRYRLDEAGRFFAAVRKLEPRTTLTVVSRADPRLVESMLETAGLPRGAWTHYALAHADVPQELRRHHVGLFFLTQGLSEHGCSPTKIGEYWASGLPVVTTPNVSDTDTIIREQRVGVIVNGNDDAGMHEGARELVELLRDKDLSSRCRRAAEASYDLEAACVRQKSLYETIAS